MLIARAVRRGRRFRWAGPGPGVGLSFEVGGDFVGEVLGVGWLIGVNLEVTDWRVGCGESFVGLRRECW